MRKLQTILLALFTLGFAACEGPTGPSGPVGPQGNTGDPGPLSLVFEYENIDFNETDDYIQVLDYPESALNDIYDSDVALVYFLWKTEEDQNIDLDIWRPLPQTVITDNGLIQYNYDFTINDVKLTMDFNFDSNLLEEQDTQNWIVRVVMVPGEFWDQNGRKKMDLSYAAISEALNLPNTPIKGDTQIIRKK